MIRHAQKQARPGPDARWVAFARCGCAVAWVSWTGAETVDDAWWAVAALTLPTPEPAPEKMLTVASAARLAQQVGRIRRKLALERMTAAAFEADGLAAQVGRVGHCPHDVPREEQQAKLAAIVAAKNAEVAGRTDATNADETGPVAASG